MQNHMKEGRVKMYTVTHIYEADFGCEERADGAKTKCVVYLEDENGRKRGLSKKDIDVLDGKWDRRGKQLERKYHR